MKNSRSTRCRTRSCCAKTPNSAKPFAWQKQSRWKLKLARVIARDPANWWRTIQIDAGSTHGVRTNLPVLTSEGLVGRIFAVGPYRSQVVLLGDPNLRVGALVQDREVRETGIILSSGNPLDNNMVDLQCFSRNSAIQPGQSVITSGEGGIFPKGIPVGQIVDLRNNVGGAFHRSPRQARGEPQRFGGSLGDVPMKAIRSRLAKFEARLSQAGFAAVVMIRL